MSKSSTPLFAAALAIFPDGEAGARTEQVIATAKMRLNVKPEFKFAKASDQVRDDFFSAVGG